MKFLSIFLWKEYKRADDTSEPNFCDIRPLRLGPLKSLQRLKITSTGVGDCSHIDDVLRKELTLMAMILASSTSPVHIRSIILETSFLEQCQKAPSMPIPDKWLPIPGSEMQHRRINFMALLPTISSQSWISSRISTTQRSHRHTAVYEMYPYES